MIHGNLVADTAEVIGDSDITNAVFPDLPGGVMVVGAVAVLTDGLGGVIGDQTVVASVRAAFDDTTRHDSEPIVITSTDEPAWRYFLFPEPPTITADTLEVILNAVGGGAAQAHGTFMTFGDTEVFVPAAVAVGVAPYVAPAILDDELAKLPLDVAEAAFAGAPVASYEADCGWWYDPANPPANASAVVRTGGALADLVGRRVRVTGPFGRTVTVYVNDEADFEEGATEQIQLARGAFERLAALNARAIAATVEVLG